MTPERGDVARRIVRRVADRSDSDPFELPPLADAVDPDAVAALVDAGGERTPTGHPSVTFTYAGRPVTVEAGGAVTVEEPATGDRGSRAAGDD